MTEANTIRFFARTLIWVAALWPGTAAPADYFPQFTPNGFEYRGKVDLAPLQVLVAAAQTNWSRVRTPQEFYAGMTRTNFFSNGDSVDIRCGYSNAPARQNPWIKLARGGRPDSGITFPVEPLDLAFGTKPACFHDYDGNGLRDLKLVFPIGGISGHSNVGQVYYFYQFPGEWRLLRFVVRDVTYTWECDLNGDGKYELLKGHHQDKEEIVYQDARRKTGAERVFQKYLFVNAYALEPSGLKLGNELSQWLPRVFPFGGKDPFDVTHDPQFMKFNQFPLPSGYTNEVRRIPN